MLKVFTGRCPFPELTDLVAVSEIMEGERPARPQERDLTDSVWDMTVRCWQEDPVLRPRIERVVTIQREGQVSPSLCTTWKPQHTFVSCSHGLPVLAAQRSGASGSSIPSDSGYVHCNFTTPQLEHLIPVNKCPLPPASGCARQPSGLPRVCQILLTNLESLPPLEGKQQNFREECHCSV